MTPVIYYRKQKPGLEHYGYTGSIALTSDFGCQMIEYYEICYVLFVFTLMRLLG